MCVCIYIYIYTRPCVDFALFRRVPLSPCRDIPSYTVESRIRANGGFGETPGKLLTLK